MIGIKDVAREVEVSTATVSRALRGLPGVSEETRALVLEAALRLGYVPSPTAVRLASGQTRAVAVVVPYVTRWFFSSVVHGAEEVLRGHDYDLLLYNLAGSTAARHRVFDADLLTKRVDAVLVLSLRPTAQELARLGRLARPVTFVGADVPGWATVRIDDKAASQTAAQHLIDLGHRRIAYVGGATTGVLDFTAPADRLAGFHAALAASGLTPDPGLELDGGFTIAGGTEAGRSLLGRPDPPTAVFAASDEMAFGVLRAARDLGLRVPEDLSVVGVDDHELADYFDLTTVAQPVLEQGRVAAHQVLAALAASGTGDSWQPQQVILATRLVVRATTAAPARSTAGARR